MRLVIVSVAVFVLLGTILIPYAGLQADEVLFAGPFFMPAYQEFCLRVSHYEIPLMIMSYIGTFKTVLYWPIFSLFGFNVFAVRLPMVFVGAATILVFYLLTVQWVGKRAALIAALLLATDPIFLLTDTFDWGPVALEHFLVVTGCWLIARKRPTLGAFLFGLALWNKALFLWMLAGLTVAAVFVYMPEIRTVLKDHRTCIRVGLAFLVGAMPFLIYNVIQPNATLSSNAHLSTENLSTKFFNLRFALAGNGLNGFIVHWDSAVQAKRPVSVPGRVAFFIREHSFGPHYTTLFPYAILLSFALIPLWWRSPGRRAALFALVSAAVAFLAMVVSRGAGASIHHTVLLWPMPHLFVGIALAALRVPWLSFGAGAVLIISNLLVVNQYVVQFERNGAKERFTDAVNSLSKTLSDSTGDSVYIIDWGIKEPVTFLEKGKSQGRSFNFMPVSATLDDAQRRAIGAVLANPYALFVAHVRSEEIFPHVGEQFESILQAECYEKTDLRLVRDSNGRPIFELFRIQRQSPDSSCEIKPPSAAMPAMHSPSK
jgi:4-amino-4-deoxy-L-arabinose transferase-like glycosyltransferase